MLCRGCHDPAQSAFIQKHRGVAVTSGCMGCHNPHSADTAALLKRVTHQPVSAGQCQQCHGTVAGPLALKKEANALCLDCHPRTQAQELHSPYRAGKCLTCHAPHASEFPAMLARPGGTLCGQCHGAMVAKKAVSDHPPFREGNCLACHLGHGATAKGLLKGGAESICLPCHDRHGGGMRVMSHQPAREGKCLVCHQPHSSDSPRLLRGGEGRICLTCHQETAREKGRVNQHRPFADGQCSQCHAPHGAPGEAMLKRPLANGELCLGCHGQLKNSPGRHAPFQQGKCLLCHNAHAGDGEALATDDAARNCLECHPAVATLLQAKGVLHQPFADRNCAACHLAHGGSLANGLKKPQPTLCLGCHQEIAQAWQEGKPHQAAVESCANCHLAHGSTKAGLLKGSLKELCLNCHPMSEKELLASHQGITPRGDSCSLCHDPHGSTEAKLLHAKGHEPFSKGECRSCHAVATELPKATMAANSICFSCHPRKAFQGRVVHRPVQEQGCAVCHSLHAAKFGGLLPVAAGKLCLRCHREIATTQRFSHQPAKDGRCLGCHAPHASESPNLLPTDLAAACFSCHKEVDKRYGQPHQPFQQGQCTACHLAHGSDTVQLLKGEDEELCQRCHAATTIRSLHSFAMPIKGCLTCHSPHGGEDKGMLRQHLHEPFKKGCTPCHQGDQPVSTRVCLKCHAQVAKDYALIHSHLTDSGTGNGCVGCHSPHAGNDRMLLVGSPQQVCLRCHQDTYARHEGKASQHQKRGECLACHAAHGGDAPAMLKGDGNTVCMACHASQGTFSHPVGEKVRDPRNGQMMTCVTCHDPKGTDFPYQLKLNGQKALCLQCHNY